MDQVSSGSGARPSLKAGPGLGRIWSISVGNQAPELLLFLPRGLVARLLLCWRLALHSVTVAACTTELMGRFTKSCAHPAMG